MDDKYKKIEQEILEQNKNKLEQTIKEFNFDTSKFSKLVYETKQKITQNYKYIHSVEVNYQSIEGIKILNKSFSDYEKEAKELEIGNPILRELFFKYLTYDQQLNENLNYIINTKKEFYNSGNQKTFNLEEKINNSSVSLENEFIDLITNREGIERKKFEFKLFEDYYSTLVNTSLLNKDRDNVIQTYFHNYGETLKKLIEKNELYEKLNDFNLYGKKNLFNDVPPAKREEIINKLSQLKQYVINPNIYTLFVEYDKMNYPVKRFWKTRKIGGTFLESVDKFSVRTSHILSTIIGASIVAAIFGFGGQCNVEYSKLYENTKNKTIEYKEYFEDSILNKYLPKSLKEIHKKGMDLEEMNEMRDAKSIN